MQRKFFTYILIFAVLFSFASQLSAQDNLDKYFKSLGSVDKSERDEAAAILVKEGAKIIPALKNTITSADSNLRQKQYAMNILGQVSDAKIMPFVLSQFNASKENVVKLECLNIASRYSAEKDAVSMFKAGVTSTNVEISLYATELVSENKVTACFAELVQNTEASKSDQVKIASALAASSMYHNNAAKDLQAKFTAALQKNIADAKENFEYKYQMIFALGYTKTDAAIQMLIDIIKDQQFINSTKQEIEKLETEFKKTEEELKDKADELKAAQEELAQKINDLRSGVAEKQIRFNDTASLILGKYFGSKAFVNFAEILKSGETTEIEETFYVYVMNCSNDVLQQMVKAFEDKAPTKVEDTEEGLKKFTEQLENFDKYMAAVKSAFVKYVVANPESYKILLPLNKFFGNVEATNRMFESLARVSTTEIFEEIINVYNAKPAISDEIKVVILRNLLGFATNDIFPQAVENYNRDSILKMLVEPSIEAINSANNKIVAEGLKIIKANSAQYLTQYKDIAESIQNILKKSDESLIALACEVLVKIDRGNAAKTMLGILDNVTEVNTRTKLLDAFAQVNFASPTEINQFLSKIENDLLDNSKDLELRKSAAKAIVKTNEPKGVALLIQALTRVEESELTDLEKYEFKSHVIEQLGMMRNAASTATKQILAEMNAALSKFNELNGTTDAVEKQLQNTLTTLIRKGLSALQNIRNIEVIEKLQNFLNLEDREINIATLNTLKALASTNDETKKMLALIFNTFATMQSTGGIETSQARVDFVIEVLQVINDRVKNITGRTKNDTRSFVRDLLTVENSDILKKAINLTSVLKDRRAISVLRDLLKRRADLKPEIDTALETLN